ncbi:MAG: MarR family winged helix-turn-helix transcriptional regulator [Dermatophilaceae bacterium]
MAGPLTVGEATAHLSRAQSVVSEIVDRLEARGLLERETDPADRRRTLVWLTKSGHEILRHDRDVLSTEHLVRAVSTMPARQVDAILTGLGVLVGHAQPTSNTTHPPHDQGDDHDLERDL